MSRRRASARTTIAALIGFVAAVVGCSTSGSSESVAPRTPVTDGSGATVTVTGRQVLDGFDQVTVRVRKADGTEQTFCLLLARTEEQRERGLMQVTDASLGGHDGMLFAFDGDTTSGFWMKDTLLPLTIAYVAGDGAVVSTQDMTPCPPDEDRCTIYPPRGQYRYAVEVPQGRLGRLGLDGAGARMTVGEESCPA